MLSFFFRTQHSTTIQKERYTMKLQLLVSLLGIWLSHSVYAQSDRLIAALIQVESSGRDTVVGDRNLRAPAYGPLQIRQPVCDDVNVRFKTHFLATEMDGNRVLSVKVCRLYLSIWATRKRLGRVPTEEDLARIWNGGPNGWKREATVPYWSKVRRYLAPQPST